jgi:hypothetical protein
MNLALIIECQHAGMIGVAPNLYDAAPRHNTDSLLVEAICQKLSNFRVFIRQRVILAGNQRNLDPIQAKHLPYLNRLAISSQNDCLLWDGFSGRRFSIGPESDVTQARNLRDSWL